MTLTASTFCKKCTASRGTRDFRTQSGICHLRMNNAQCLNNNLIQLILTTFVK